MSELRIYQYACNGPSCHRCEELKPGFISEHNGKMQFTPEQEKIDAALIEEMLNECSTSALSFD